MSFKRASSVELFTRPAREFVSDDFVAVDAGAGIGDVVAAARRARKSTLLVTEKSRLAGIITEQDIVRRLAFRADPGDAARMHMTRPVEFIYENDLLFHAIGKMREAKLRHLPVVSLNGGITGILNLHDALAAQLGDTIRHIDGITCDKDEAGIRALKQKQGELADALLQDKVNAFDISYLLSFLNTVIYRRAIRLSLARVAGNNRGDTPAFCVLVMGSGGRMESFLHPDQDNGIIYQLDAGDARDDETKKHIDRHFFELAKEFTAILDFAGIPLCKGNLMATNPLWRHSLQDWQAQVDDWVQKPNDDTLRYMDMLYDFRPVFGDVELAHRLRAFLLRRLEKTPQFLKYLYRRDEATRPAIGLFGRFVVEKDDPENRGMLNLKHTGTLPLVEAARMYSIKHNVDRVSTIERLQALTGLGVFSREEFDFFKSALEFLSGLLLRNQVRQARQNAAIKNYIDPKALLPRETRLLKIYLKEIKKLKTRVRGDFGEEYV